MLLQKPVRCHQSITRMARLAQDNSSGIPDDDNHRKSTGGKAFRGIGEGRLLPRGTHIMLFGACVITLMCQYSSVCPIRSLRMISFLPVYVVLRKGCEPERHRRRSKASGKVVLSGTSLFSLQRGGRHGRTSE
jgi:hypothetical protein